MGEVSEAEREAVLWKLAKALYWRMEQLAPEGACWDSTTQDERDFCYECALALMRETDLIDRYYGRTPTTT